MKSAKGSYAVGLVFGCWRSVAYSQIKAQVTSRESRAGGGEKRQTDRQTERKTGRDRKKETEMKKPGSKDRAADFLSHASAFVLSAVVPSPRSDVCLYVNTPPPHTHRN